MSIDLLPLVEHLNQCLGAHADQEVEWCQRLYEALERLKLGLRSHALEADGPDGLARCLDPARRGLAYEVEELSKEHGFLLGQLRCLQASVRNALRGFEFLRRQASRGRGVSQGFLNLAVQDLAQIRGHAKLLCESVARHWEAEADLLIERVIRGIGGGTGRADLDIQPSAPVCSSVLGMAVAPKKESRRLSPRGPSRNLPSEGGFGESPHANLRLLRRVARGG